MEGNKDEDSDITRALIAYLNETNERVWTPPLRHVYRKRLMQDTKRVDHEVSKIHTANITETNQLMYACARVVSERLGVKLTSEKRKYTGISPWKSDYAINLGQEEEYKQDGCSRTRSTQKSKGKETDRAEIPEKWEECVNFLPLKN